MPLVHYLPNFLGDNAFLGYLFTLFDKIPLKTMLTLDLFILYRKFPLEIMLSLDLFVLYSGFPLETMLFLGRYPFGIFSCKQYFTWLSLDGLTSITQLARLSILSLH